MITCIKKAFTDIPATKYYNYHGMIMPCNIQPDPECFKTYDTGEGTPTWVRLYCNLRVVGDYFYLYYDVADVLPSGWIDQCVHKFPDREERYYFLELYLQKDPSYPTIQIDINYGNQCKFFEYIMTEQLENIAMVFNLFAGYDWIFRYKYLQAASANKVWKTSNGRFNQNWPVPLIWKYS